MRWRKASKSDNYPESQMVNQVGIRWMTEDRSATLGDACQSKNIVEVPFDREHLLEVILSPDNMNKAYKAVVRNMRNRMYGGVRGR